MIDRYVQRLLDNDKTLRVVSINTLNFHDHDVGRVFEALKTNVAVRELDLSHCRLDSECQRILKEMLPINTKISEIDISFNNLVNDVPFLEILRDLPRLRVLKMRDCNIFVDRLEFAGLNPRLTTLDISNADTIMPDKKKFFNLLRAMPNLTDLDISYTMYSDGPEVCDYLTEGPPLHTLKLAGGPFASIATALKQCTSLRHLHIRRARWELDDIDMYYPIFTQLKTIDLYGGYFSQVAGSFLIKFIGENHPCEFLNIDARDPVGMTYHPHDTRRHSTGILLNTHSHALVLAFSRNTTLQEFRVPQSFRIPTSIYFKLKRNKKRNTRFFDIMASFLDERKKLSFV